MHIEQRSTNDPSVVVVEMSGPMDTYDSARVRQTFDDLTAQHLLKVILLLTRVAYLDFGAISAIVFGTNMYRGNAGGRLNLVVSEKQMRTLRQMRFDRRDGLGLVFATERDAVEAFKWEPPRLADTG